MTALVGARVRYAVLGGMAVTLVVLTAGLVAAVIVLPDDAEPFPSRALRALDAPDLPSVVSAAGPAVTYERAFGDLPAYTRPVALVDLPGTEAMLLALQEGRIIVVPDEGDRRLPDVALDLRDDTVCCGTEEGLLSIAADPGFETNGYVYVYRSPRGEPKRTVLSRFTAAAAGAEVAVDPASELRILEVRQPRGNHNGGSVVFGPDGMLYLSFGDGGGAGDPFESGQDRGGWLSTVLRIDVRGATAAAPYRVPPDNPFVGVDGAAPEVWAYGLRNPWRMSFDRETGALWAGDVGQNAIEEIDIIEPGANYGWSVYEGDTCFGEPSECDLENTVPPVAVYDHALGCAVTGGYVYRGEAIPELRGWYLAGDFCSGRVWAIRAEPDGTGEREMVLLWDEGPSVTAFAEDASGELYLLSFEGARVYRIVGIGDGAESGRPTPR